jgi:hypothetical protein
MQRGCLSRVPGRRGHGELILQRQRRAGEAAGERDSPGQRLRHRADDGKVRGHAGLGEPGADALVAGGAAELGARKPRQLEVVEEDLHELLARQREDEVVLTVALATFAVAATATAAVRPLNAIAGHVFAVARQHEFAIATMAEGEGGLRQVLLRHPDFAAAFHVGETPFADHLLDRFPDVQLVAAQEPLAIDRALAAIVGSTIDQVSHDSAPAVELPPFTMTCAPAGTIRRAAAPAFPYSISPPCERRNSGASAGRRSKPWR